MNIILQSNHSRAENPKLSKVLIFFRMFIVGLLLFLNCNTYAQEGFGKTSSQVIMLSGGSTIYSADESFNHQISTQKITILNAEVISQKTNSQDLLVVSGKESVDNHSDLKKQLAASELKKKREALKSIKKKVHDFESRKNVFIAYKIRVFPSSDEFVGLAHINHDYVAPGNHHSFSNVYAEVNQSLISQALDYLHTQKYTFYNNKSLDFCFSEVFSVRPPPVLV